MNLELLSKIETKLKANKLAMVKEIKDKHDKFPEKKHFKQIGKYEDFDITIRVHLK